MTLKDEPYDDPHLWLETIDSKESMDWVERRNAQTAARFTEDESFRALRDSVLTLLEAKDRPPGCVRFGEWFYNFWRDETHRRGVWRRTSLASYGSDDTEWDVILDLDALAEAEDESWVWKGALGLRPQWCRFLITLSRGGSDATVTREYDVDQLRFVEDGFVRPEAKGSMRWIDHDTVYLMTDTGEGSLTDSGYPRQVRRLSRGQSMEDTLALFEGASSSISVGAYVDKHPGYGRHLVTESTGFYESITYELIDGVFNKIALPDDTVRGVHRDWLVVNPRTDWQFGDQLIKQGALGVCRYADFMAGRVDHFDLLFEPTETTSLSHWCWTRDWLILVLTADVRTRIVVWRYENDVWRNSALEGLPADLEVSLWPEDPVEGNALWCVTEHFLEPWSLWRIEQEQPPALIKQEPARYDASGLTAVQHFAISDDGTRVPYFEIGPADRKDPAPTVLYGYGGFENSMLPHYLKNLGVSWFGHGGVFVIANIRGGGEYGPSWHQAAIKENRPRAFEDFECVARDLIRRGVTVPKKLGIRGGSNGGLLVANCMLRTPELFGAVVCEVPLLDMRRYTKLLAGASWIDEYGDPDDFQVWTWLQHHSPYHNVAVYDEQSTPLPTLLVTSSTQDDRVHPGHGRKFVARLMERGHENVFYFENTEGGHAGAIDGPRQAFNQALAWTFFRKFLDA